jgi:hypothetical protein
MIFEAVSDQGFEWVKLFVNDEFVNQLHHVTSVQLTLPTDTQSLSLEFFPFKQKPLVRIDDFLLNYWLADIKLWDHRIDVDVGNDFYERYQQRDFQGRLAHLTPEQLGQHHYQDKYIGINNLYPELVEKIRNIIQQ